ncbi:hypothetical protein L2E82_34580 [Cichorium intybus]|uniref:Uncharacterized protein n=1 Tax=Cichorium intybus TaxID=13427 RepID=A0ACB9BMD3_CICIN|nr:hypothetical protein L2E82_34580 [Cichorium intybus]
MTTTTDHPNDKEPQHPAPANADYCYEQQLPPPLMNHHREEPSYPPLPPPFHDFQSYKQLSIYLSHLLLHLTRLNHHNPTCSFCDEGSSPLPPTPNANGHYDQPPDASTSSMAEHHRLPPPPQPIYLVCHQCIRHTPHMSPIIHPHTNLQNPVDYLENKPIFRVYSYNVIGGF